MNAPEFDIDSAARRIASVIASTCARTEADLYTTIKAMLAGSPSVVSEGQAVRDAILQLPFVRDSAGNALLERAAVERLLYTRPAAPAPEAPTPPQEAV